MASESIAAKLILIDKYQPVSPVNNMTTETIIIIVIMLVTFLLSIADGFYTAPRLFIVMLVMLLLTIAIVCTLTGPILSSW
jgi:hypothetical protein